MSAASFAAELPSGWNDAFIVQVAMDEEAAPFLAMTESAGEPLTRGAATFYPRLANVGEGEQKILLVRSQIGLVNAATALTSALHLSLDTPLVISAGSAGGLRTDVNVGDIVVGQDFTFTDADASAFGYVRGQVPGMPETYSASSQALQHAQDIRLEDFEGSVHTGLMLAGGSFVTAHNVADTREVFPQALSTDMETTALAQTCHTHGVPFIATRAISDLCGPTADQVFHLEIDLVAPLSARFALALIDQFATSGGKHAGS